MPKIIRVAIFISLVFVKGWVDILPDPDKYHYYSTKVVIDNISKYSKRFDFIVLYTLYFDGYPHIELIKDSIPPAPKWSKIYIFALNKGLLDNKSFDEVASELIELVNEMGFSPFPVATKEHIFISNTYPIKSDEYHYKIESIKKSKVRLKLHKRVIEFLDGDSKVIRW